MICVDKGKNNKGYYKVHKLVISLNDQGEGTGKVCRKLLCDLPLKGEKICNTADDIAKHDTNQRYEHSILNFDPLYKEHKKQCTDNGQNKGKNRSHTKSHCREKDHGKSNTELRGLDGGARSRRNKLIHT